MMRNIKLTLQYDGTRYSGWQIQPNAETIQDTIQQVVGKITGEKPSLLGAGRTDAGVHAIAQVASFKTSSIIAPDILRNALNARLPYDIRVLEACDVPGDFNPRYDARGKCYLYVISRSRILSPFFSRYAWRISHELNIDAMDRALAILKGQQDFSAFRASGCGAKSPMRNITDVTIKRLEGMEFMSVTLGGEFITIRIEADAFLRHMVRNIVGTVVDVGKGKLTEGDVADILLSKDRKKAGPTAPAQGLFLEKIYYGDPLP